MDRISRVEVFLEVVRQRGFTGAGQVLGMTGSAVSKQFGNLEKYLGVKLFHRTTRQVSLTEEGTLYFERASRALDDLAEAKAMLQERKVKPTGLLKVNLPMSFGLAYLSEPIAAFAEAYPEVEMEVTFDDREIDLIAEGYDAIVRIGVLKDSGLVKKKLAECPIVCCASPAYLERFGAPQHPAELAKHRLLLYNRQRGESLWRWQDDDGNTGLERLAAVFKANSAKMLLVTALRGNGLVFSPIFSAAPYLRSGELVRVLPAYESHPRREIAVLYSPGRQLSSKVRLFIDWVFESCRSLPW